MNTDRPHTRSPAPFPWDFHLARLLYTGVYAGAALAYHNVKRLRGRVSAEAIAERRGKPVIRGGPSPLWVHTSSMGEVRLAAGLLEKLAEKPSPAGFLCSVSTETGYTLARNTIPSSTVVVRAPVDLPRAIFSFLKWFNPSALILIETEWWPNQLAACFRRGVPVFVANGRLSAKSLKRYQWVRRYLGPLLCRIERFYMRSSADAERVLRLGVDPRRVEVAGSLKNAADAGKLLMRSGVPDGPPIFLAGCTRPGEETIILDAFRSARENNKKLRLWLAPRHPERFDEVAGIIRESGYRWAALSVLPRKRLCAEDSPEIVLIDKMGVLAAMYEHAHVAFVGGSLRPFGGHNPVEPVLAGAPVLFGPYTEEQAEAASALENAGLGQRVNDARSLAAAIVQAIKDPPDPHSWNRRRREFFAGFSDAARRVASDILQRLDALNALPSREKKSAR